MARFRQPFLIRVTLLLAILLGAYFRFSYLNWDQGFAYHPDERNIALAVTRLKLPWQLDPGFHAYNGFSIYLIRLLAQVLAAVRSDPSWLTNWGQINLISRFLSAIFSTLSLFLLYLLGRRLFSPTVGLLGASLMAFTPGLVQYAHYGVTESLLVFWLLLLALLSLNILKHPRSLLLWAQMAVVSGLALGTKTSAASFLLIPLATWLLTLGKHDLIKSVLSGIYFFSLALVTFFVVSPYSFLNFPKFQESMNYEGGVVSGRLSVPYTLQFTTTPSYLYFLKNLPWQLGPLLPILGFSGIFFLLYLSLAKRKLSYLPLLLFFAIYFLYVGRWHTKFLRYMIPLLPLLILATSNILVGIHRRFPVLSRSLIVITLLTSFLWTLAHHQVYSSTHSRILASRWIYDNLPKKSVILHEHWDDRLPTRFRDQTKQFVFEEVKSYDADTEKKFQKLRDQLTKADYYIISSRRVYGSILKNPDRYPRMSLFYQQLFSGQLGFELIQTFDSYPRLGNLIINDDTAEETFQIYDHPVVYIFKKIDSPIYKF